MVNKALHKSFHECLRWMTLCRNADRKKPLSKCVPLFLGIADSMCCKTHKACENWRLEYALMATGGTEYHARQIIFLPRRRTACSARLKINRNWCAHGGRKKRNLTGGKGEIGLAGIEGVGVECASLLPSVSTYYRRQTKTIALRHHWQIAACCVITITALLAASDRFARQCQTMLA